MSQLNEGIDISCVKVDEKYQTGFQLKSKVLSGDPKVQYFRKGSAASNISKEDISYEYIKSARHLHATGIIPATSITAKEYSNEDEKDAIELALEEEQKGIKPVKNYGEAFKSPTVIILSLQYFFIIPEILPKNVSGGAMALINSMGALGSFIGSYVVGYLNGATGSPSASYAFMAGSLLLAVILTVIVKTPKVSKRDNSELKTANN